MFVEGLGEGLPWHPQEGNGEFFSACGELAKESWEVGEAAGSFLREGMGWGVTVPGMNGQCWGKV